MRLERLLPSSQVSSWVGGQSPIRVPSRSRFTTLFRRDWAADGYNGIIAAAGERLSAAMAQGGGYLNPAVGVPTATPSAPRLTPPADSVLFATSESSNLDAYRLAFRAFDHVTTTQRERRRRR